MIRKGGLPFRPLSSWALWLVQGTFILLATLLTVAGVVFVTPTPAPTAPPSPGCTPYPRR